MDLVIVLVCRVHYSEILYTSAHIFFYLVFKVFRHFTGMAMGVLQADCGSSVGS